MPLLKKLITADPLDQVLGVRLPARREKLNACPKAALELPEPTAAIGPLVHPREACRARKTAIASLKRWPFPRVSLVSCRSGQAPLVPQMKAVPPVQ
jgi:hypothetical protein